LTSAGAEITKLNRTNKETTANSETLVNLCLSIFYLLLFIIRLALDSSRQNLMNDLWLTSIPDEGCLSRGKISPEEFLLRENRRF
jgi:hypothetical protein